MTITNCFCDVCMKQLDKNERVQLTIQPEHSYVIYGGGRAEHILHGEYDLCSDCTKEFMDYIERKKKNFMREDW